MQPYNGNPLALGGHFVLDGQAYTTDRYLSMSSIVAARESDGTRVTLQIQDIVRAFALSQDLGEAEEVESSGHEKLSEEDWAIGTARRDKLELLVTAEHSTRAMATEIGAALGRSPSTIYRWRGKYIKGGKARDFAPYHPTGGRGKSRISDTTETVLAELIEEKYLTSQKLKPTDLMEDLEARCRRAGVNPPHINTVRRRIAALDEVRRLRAREGKDAVKKFKPTPGRFPGADYPNAVWQIDHTPVDVCIVDDVYRRNIGRAWMTVAIDVFSRCVVGFYLSLDKPNAMSVGMCLVHAILPKEGWLAAHDVKAPWPIWGRPVTVHADNDKTFRCEMVSRAAKEYGINLEWRPVRTPEWGGHIERLLGTLNAMLHTLPGTTFSNPTERGKYKPHEEATHTFSELETTLAEMVCGKYHQKPHSGISNRIPIRRYELGILGDDTQLGTGLPAPEVDPARLRLDFLPYKECTVQSYGVVWDNITYYDTAIDRWIHAKDPDTGKKRRFTCRRDPRDVSFLFFLDPDKNRYVRVPYRHVEHPSINLWELREVRRQLTLEGRKQVDEELIFATHERLQAINQDASQQTQAARKAAQKKKVYKAKATAEEAQVQGAFPPKAPTPISKQTNQSHTAVDAWDDTDDVPTFSE